MRSRARAASPRLLLALAVGLAVSVPSVAEESKIRFVDATKQSAMDFVHFNGLSGERYLVETMGSGVCVLDYDNDHRPDVYLIQGAPTPGSANPDPPPRNALYRNLGNARFADVTVQAGVGDPGQGQGCTAGDIDGDGDLDLYVVNFGPNVLYLNNGDGTFKDVTARANVGDDRWGSSAAFADVDGDGYLDLYVTNYVDMRYDNHKYCGHVRTELTSGKINFYCSPLAYEPELDVFYRNNGDGTFRDATREAGMFNDTDANGLGVIFGDVDSDGDQDAYVANDAKRNFLYRNDGKGNFKDIAMLAGVGFSEAGMAQAGMGVDFGDMDNDGHLDLVVTNLSNETNQIYRNLGRGIFVDPTFKSGVGAISMLYVGFGVVWIDIDQDADLDLFVNNGHILDNVKLLSDIMTFAQRNHVYENVGDGKFLEISTQAGPGLEPVEVGRGLAQADFDGDGDQDLVLSNNGERAVLLLNETTGAGHFLRVRLTGKAPNRFAIGARITLEAGGISQIREVRTASSYQSQSELVMHFGLAGATAVQRLQVRWPSGDLEEFDVPGVDRVIRLEQGTGRRAAGGPAERASTDTTPSE